MRADNIDCDDVVQIVRQDTSSSNSGEIFKNLALTLYVILSVLLNGLFTPLAKRGFFCNDATIQYPIKSDTVTFQVMMFCNMVIPAIVIKICDWQLKRLKNLRHPRSRQRKISDNPSDLVNRTTNNSDEHCGRVKRRLVVNDDEDAQETQDLCKVCDISDDSLDQSRTAQQRSNQRAFRSRVSYSDMQLFMFGFATTCLFTGIGKTTCGRLRPHFIQRCRPNVDCNLSSNLYQYIEDFTCTNNLRQRDINYISTSWPSGHASVSFYSMLYMIFYLQSVTTSIRKYRRASRSDLQPLIMSFIYSLMFGLAIYISMTRISDYHHHPTDVLSGVIIGSIVAVVQAKFLLEPLRKQSVDSLIGSNLSCPVAQ